MVGPPVNRRQYAGRNASFRNIGPVLGAHGDGEGVRPGHDAQVSALSDGLLPAVPRPGGDRRASAVVRGTAAGVYPLRERGRGAVLPEGDDWRRGRESRFARAGPPLWLYAAPISDVVCFGGRLAGTDAAGVAIPDQGPVRRHHNFFQPRGPRVS